MRVGPLEVGTIGVWQPTVGSAVTWQPTAATIAKAAAAPVSDVPIGYMQAQHIRGYRQQKAGGLDYSRLMVVSCDAPGRCDVRAMTFVVNSHLRRQDTYRSWFEIADDGHIVRRKISNPADIEFRPTHHGELSLGELRSLAVSTPDPDNWDCFRFGIVQGPDSFTFFASIDHVHVDAMIVGVTLMEFFMMYSALVGGGAPLKLPDAGSYEEFCRRQREYTDALAPDSPEVRAWVEYARNNGGSYPDFPLSLGDSSVPCTADMVTATMMDEERTARFESVCTAAGSRFIGGVLACCAQVERDFTGADTYYGLTPKDNRRSAAEAMTQGWFTGLIPITVPIAGQSFGDAARAAQESFDGSRPMAKLPFDRVRELVPTLSHPRPNFPVINFLDAGTAPLSALLTAELGDLNVGVYGDGRYSYQLSIYVIRVKEQTAVTVMFPDNPIARESVDRYLGALKRVFQHVAGTGRWPAPVDAVRPQETLEPEVAVFSVR